MADTLTDFLFPAFGVRGAVVEITTGIADMLGCRVYAPDVRKIVGQAIAAMPLLASHSKFEGRINLQFQEGKGAIKLLVAQIDRHLVVRGMAKAAEDAQGTFEELVQGGTLAMMLDPDVGTQNYQAFVPTEGAALANALETYFMQSEQLPTMMRLGMSEGRLSGILLQRLPEGVADENGWEHLQALLGTLDETELTSIDAQTLMHRLFHAEELRMFEPRTVKLSCRCDRGSIATMLLGLGEEELAPVVEERGKVDVTCEFCGREYIFTPIEVKELFSAAIGDPPTPTRH
ncbi:MAG: Hsp33 family molecular chaperone HslO [Pseudomonadota bacterium]